MFVYNLYSCGGENEAEQVNNYWSEMPTSLTHTSITSKSSSQINNSSVTNKVYGLINMLNKLERFKNFTEFSSENAIRRFNVFAEVSRYINLTWVRR